jgi:hypothetical protein
MSNTDLEVSKPQKIIICFSVEHKLGQTCTIASKVGMIVNRKDAAGSGHALLRGSIQHLPEETEGKDGELPLRMSVSLLALDLGTT